MRLRKRCAAWLGLAAGCLFAIGCGGSDIPDPGSDANAAGGNPPGAGGGGPEPAGAAPAPVVAAAEQPKADEEAPAATAPTPPASGQGGDASKDQSKGNSTTSEMLALAGGPNPPPAGGGASPKQPEPGASPPGGAPAPGSPPAGGAPAPGARGGSAGPGPMAPGAGGGGPRMGPCGPGMQPGGQQHDTAKMMAGMQSQMQKQMQDQMKGRGGAGQQPGPGGGGAAVDNAPADFHSPTGAVKTFLSALKAKDQDRLSEATARRAASESSAKNQEIFTKILEVSLSDSELDDLAKKLEGYQVAGENPPKSTGRVDVVIQKSDGGGSYSRRRITARHEKKGWGVLDISPEQVFKTLGSRRVSKK
jgi:hypothetical protein